MHSPRPARALAHRPSRNLNRQGESKSQQNAGIAQLVEQLICNQKVAGSIPAAGTSNPSKAIHGRSQSVSQLLIS